MEAQSRQENSGRGGGEGGVDLKALREARGLTINDINQATRISVANLESLEKGEFQHLPPPIYTKAYINAYEKLLDIDAKQIIIRYDKYLAAVAGAEEEEPCQLTEGGGFFSKRVVITASILAAFFFAGFYIYFYSNFQLSDAPTVASLSMKSQESPVEVMNNNSATENPEIASQANSGGAAENEQMQAGTSVPAVGDELSKDIDRRNENPSPVTSALSNPLIIRAKEMTWLRISEGNKEPYQILMKPGERVERSAPQFTIDVGNAAGITIEFQGKTMESLGKSGEVVHLRLP